jgi:hypothetical protein
MKVTARVTQRLWTTAGRRASRVPGGWEGLPRLSARSRVSDRPGTATVRLVAHAPRFGVGAFSGVQVATLPVAVAQPRPRTPQRPHDKEHRSASARRSNPMGRRSRSDPRGRLIGAVPLWYQPLRPMRLGGPLAGTTGTAGTAVEASARTLRRRGAGRSQVHPVSPTSESPANQAFSVAPCRAATPRAQTGNKFTANPGRRDGCRN